jgi:hypothetical protein
MIQPKKLKAMPRGSGEMARQLGRRIGTRPRPYIEPREWPTETTAKERISILLNEAWHTVRELSEIADIGDSTARNYLQLFIDAGIVETIIGSGAEPNRYRRTKEAPCK